MGVVLLAPPKPLEHVGLQRDLAALAMCESTNRTNAVSRSGKYRGLYQFDRPTWQSVGGTGDPAVASYTEQTRRARQLYKARGWQPWPQCAAKLALVDKRR